MQPPWLPELPNRHSESGTDVAITRAISNIETALLTCQAGNSKDSFAELLWREITCRASPCSRPLLTQKYECLREDTRPELLILPLALCICDRTHNRGHAAKRAIALDEVYGKTGSSEVITVETRP